jgi:phage tail P2-like protein
MEGLKMISLRNVKLTDSLPDVIASQPWAQAMSAAWERQVRRIVDLAERARMYAAVDVMPHAVLDLMAHDLKVPQYRETYHIDTKRTLIKAALTYWRKAGTKAAVEQLCRDIFGDATVYEWHEYDGQPGYFRVSTTNPNVTPATVDEFRAAVEAIKRLSAWLEAVELLANIPSHITYEAFVLHTATKIGLTTR